MFRALVIFGTAIDLIIALFLLLVSGWVIDSWHDQRVAFTGMIVTAAWLIAFVMAAGSPLLAYGLRPVARAATVSPGDALAAGLPSDRDLRGRIDRVAALSPRSGGRAKHDAAGPWLRAPG